MKERILIIDGSSLFFRAFYALPLLKTKRGIYTNAIYGFIMMLENAIEKVNPSYVTVCFDMKGKTFRNELYEDYKGTRQTTPTELEQQWPIVRDILDKMNIKILESPIYEADDIAGTLSLIAEKEGFESILLTGDKDYFQLVDENTKVLLTRKGITEMDIISVESIEEEYNITPIEFIDLKGLMGDSSDNIPGVPGIGEKTGLKLIREFGTMENLYSNLDKITGKKLKENLENNKTQAFMSKKLGTIVRNVPLEVTIEDLKMKERNLSELSEMYREYEFNSLLERLPEEYHKADIEITSKALFEYEDRSIDELIKLIENEKSFAFKFITDGKIYESIKPTHIALKAYNNKPVIMEVNDNDILKLKPIFESSKIEKIGHNLKEDIIILMGYGIVIDKYTYDSKIAEYLLNSTDSNYDINNISNIYFNEGYKDLEELLGKGKKKVAFTDLDEVELKKYFAFFLNTVYKLKDIHLGKIAEQGMDELFYEVELPLIEVLSSMEFTGIRTRKSILDEIGFDLEDKLKELEKNIYLEAGEEFNINSPKKLGFILFEKLNYPVIKKTKTGYSTSAEVLEKLRGKGEIIDYVLEYRKLSKLKSTYVDGLKELVNDSTGRIHSHFNQTVTSTGRISSTEPNLQNIPIRTEEGRLIRKAFLASENSLLVDADYSQIELRVLASISKDKNMLKAFENDDDIHKRTAAEVFGVEFEEVTPLLRSRAKAVNFGIVYGISDYGLSQNLNIPRNVAGEYISNYLKHYEGIKNYMEEEVENARKKGYVETILKRRRYIPELNAKNYNIRAFGERVAFNTPIQGSAADIIKIAMVRVYRELKEKNYKSKLILQIHDELIVDAHEDETEEVKALMRRIMENAVKLEVKLKVDMEVGSSLYDTK
ncbi:DNA polymerase I [Anaerosphaera multitolerans]|uniref:DNA polymerase I n=1 Tax=Anaerosphaera multitolerans TaxID=2487351 RepID=A0A437S7S1_9FIRM|nr:DNA polymerase I [Anaerosphaera multitolerans]RVU54984.1 DNA polymerase I [Anaerosphaera multitolerans]